MIILRCVICDSERTCYGRSVNITTTLACADCGGCSWEVLMADGDAAMMLSTADLRQTAERHLYYQSFHYGSMGEYLEDE